MHYTDDGLHDNSTVGQPHDDSHLSSVMINQATITFQNNINVGLSNSIVASPSAPIHKHKSRTL